MKQYIMGDKSRETEAEEGGQAGGLERIPGDGQKSESKEERAPWIFTFR